MSKFIDIPYNREKVIAYANKWESSRNPNYYDFSKIGGDCTNFASQCLYAGCGIMNYTKTYGWYYNSVHDRAPSWTSVQYFYRFVTQNKGVGPYGIIVAQNEVEPGDFVQIHFRSKAGFTHTPIIVNTADTNSLKSIYVAAHSFDCNHRPLSTYQDVEELRFIHILGARK